MLPQKLLDKFDFGHADSQQNLFAWGHKLFPGYTTLPQKKPAPQILLKFGMKDFSYTSSNSNSWIYWFIVKTSLLKVINSPFHTEHNPSTDLQNPIQGTVTDLHVILSVLQEHLINQGTLLVILCIKLLSTSFPLLSSTQKFLKCHSEGKFLYKGASEFNYKQFCIYILKVIKQHSSFTIIIIVSVLQVVRHLLLVVGFVTGVPETPIPIRLSSSPDVGSKVSGGQLKVGIASSASGWCAPASTAISRSANRIFIAAATHMEEIIGFWKREVKVLIITTILDKCNSHKFDYKSHSSTNNSCVPTVILA